jgi:hypothetical protein
MGHSSLLWGINPVALTIATAITIGAGWYALVRWKPRVLAPLLVLGVLVAAIPQWFLGESQSSFEFRGLAQKLPSDVKALSGDVGMEVGLWTRLDCREDLGPDVNYVLTLTPRDLPLKPSEVVEQYRTTLPGLNAPVFLLKIAR